MKRFCEGALMAALVAVAMGPMAGGKPPPALEVPRREPLEVFREACDRVVALEAKHDLLKGFSQVQATIERDGKDRLKSARLVFERNAVPPGKGPAKPKDESSPFFYVSVHVWSGRSQQPPPALDEFQWKGQTYQMWVRVFGSDAELVKTVSKAVDQRSPHEEKLCGN